MTTRISIPPPADATPRYQDGWSRADAIARSGGDLQMDGPPKADQETWEGFVDCLSAHREAESRA